MLLVGQLWHKHYIGWWSNKFVKHCIYIYIYEYTTVYISYVWGRGQNTLPRVKSDTVIITDVNTQGKCVMDDSQIQAG